MQMHPIHGARALANSTALAAVLASVGTFPLFNDGDDIEEISDATIQGYRERQATMAADSQAILAKLDEEKREPTAEEQKLVNENTAEIGRLQNLITMRADALRQVQALAQPAGRKTTPTGPDADNPNPANPQASQRNPPAFAAARDKLHPGVHSKTLGFGHFGEFGHAVLRAVAGQGMDARLKMAAAGTIATEGVGAEGGFLVPTEYRDRILSHVFNENNLLARTDQQITTKNSMSFPKDEATPWGTSGVRVFWESEAAAIQQSRPVFGTMDLKLSKLAALIPVTEELLEDSAGLGAYLEGAAGRGMNHAVGNAIIDGTGAGQPLGFLRSNALVTVAAEGAQVADTFNIHNASKMWVRMPVESRLSAIWLVNPDIEQQLIVMTLGGTAAAYPIYMPPGAASASPFATLLGRPVVPNLSMKAIGDVGDVAFADLKQYVSLVKTGGIKSDVSMHLWFDQSLAAFKFTLRMDGRPWQSSPITPPNGSSTLSPFICLAAR